MGRTLLFPRPKTASQCTRAPRRTHDAIPHLSAARAAPAPHQTRAPAHASSPPRSTTHAPSLAAPRRRPSRAPAKAAYHGELLSSPSKLTSRCKPPPSLYKRTCDDLPSIPLPFLLHYAPHGWSISTFPHFVFELPAMTVLHQNPPHPRHSLSGPSCASA